MSERFELTVKGYRRSYRLHTPEGIQPGEPVPLLVFLHGKGGTAEWAEEETGWSLFADRKRFTVLYPEALPPRLEKDPKFLTNPPTWHDGSPADTGQIDDLAYLNEVVQTASIGSTSIHLSGFSNGAAMVFRLASAFPERFTAIAPVAGYCWVEPDPLPRSIPTLYLIGDQDPLIPLEGGRVVTPWRTTEERPGLWVTLDRWQRANGYFPKGFSLSDPRGIEWRHFLSRGDGVMQIGVIPGLGHHWPGGKGGLGEKLGGPIRELPRATELIWEFFQSIPSK